VKWNTFGKKKGGEGRSRARKKDQVLGKKGQGHKGGFPEKRFYSGGIEKLPLLRKVQCEDEEEMEDKDAFQGQI